jgi:PAS domain S-box-containing protein
MTRVAAHLQRWADIIFRGILAAVRGLTKPSVSVEPKQRRRIQLLAALLILLAINTLIDAVILKNIGGNAWMILVATSVALILGYAISRTRYWRAALILAITVPAIPPLAVSIFKPPEVYLTAELMWLAVPLVVSSLMLTMWQTIALALFYIIFISALKISGLIEYKDLAPVIGYLSVITFLVIAVSAVRRRDQSAIENQLAERVRAENLQADEITVLTLLERGAALNEILDAIMRLGEAHDPSIKGSILLIDDTRERLHQAAAPSLPEEYQETMKDGIPVGPNMGACGTAAYSKKRVIIEDIEHNSSFPAEAGRVAVRNGLRAVWSEPIIASNGELLGTIANYSDKTGVPDSSDLRVLEWSARIAALAIESKRAEKAIRESEERFRSIVENSHDGILILDDAYRVIYANDKLYRMSRYSHEEVIGQDFRNFLDEESKQLIAERYIQRQRGEEVPPRYEFNIVRKDGQKRRVEISSSVIKDSAGKVKTVAQIMDITERKQMEKELADEATRRRILVEQSRDGIVILDREGKVYEANRRFAEMLGYSSEEMLKLQVWDWEYLYPPEQVKEMLRTVDETGDHFETRHRRKDGTTLEVEISTNAAIFSGQKLIFCVVRDISERTRMEKALRESEEKFSKAFHTSPNAIAITTIKEGKYIEVNDSYAQSTGYTAQELIGRNATDINIWTKPEDRDRLFKIYNEKGRVSNEEFDFRMKSGEVRTWLFSAERIDIAGEPCLIGVSIDITERKKAEAALKESEEKFSIAFRSSPNTMVISTVKEGKFIEINDSHTRLTGYTREDTIGHTAVELGLWAKAEDRARMINILKKQGRVYNEEFVFRMKSGELRDWLFSAEPITIGGKPCLISITTDITEQKRMQQALRESEEKFSKAFNASPDCMAIVRVKDNVFVDVNENFIKYHGFPREEVIGHTATELGIWTNSKERDRIMKIMTEKGSVHNEEFHLRTKSGKIRLGLFSAGVVNIQGEPHSVAMTVDITEQKEAEAKLKEALFNLERSNTQLAATNKEMEAFSYSVSHDLRSPLRSIDGFSQALLEDYTEKLDKKGQDYLNRLRSASQKMGELIDGILKLSRLTRSEMRHEPIDLSALAREISGRLQETQPERRAEFVIDDQLTANGDPQLVRVVLENLLDNAWKFTSKKPSAKIEFGVEKQNGRQAYFIRDNGAGFDMTYVDKLFGAFQRLHEVTEFPGTGIGLATVQRIINRHGGTIRAEGKPGKGATFYFTLD